MVLVIFRSVLREGVDGKYSVIAKEMEELVSTMPGFISAKDFTAADGERVSIIEFESEEAIQAWYRHPDHLIAQQRGRDEFYKSFKVDVCTPTRSYSVQC
jgi:heme-degrading monooxygenase HmoA